MSLNHLYPFVSVIIVSLISLVGILFLSLNEINLKKYLNIFISLAIGALLGGAFIHIIPEAIKDSNNITLTGLFFVVGIILFFVLEKFLHWHHHGENKGQCVHPVGKLILFSDGIHNFIDGIIIGASFLINIQVGIATTIAVILHEIPQEIGDFGVLLHAGYTKKRALWLNFISALFAVVGVFVSFIVGDLMENFIVWVLPIAAGGFIYVAIADLIPELQKDKKIKRSFLQVLTVVVGVFLMFLLTFLE